MERISRDEMLIGVASLAAERSTCSRAQVGVVIARDSRPLVTGYNGAPAGLPHCRHECICMTPEYKQGPQPHSNICPADKPCKIAIHAEANAIAYAARLGIRIEGSSLYTTLTPCLACAQLIVASGITRVVSLHQYRDPAGIQYLENSGVDIS